uniref:Uncharacterized protein n=1 Tax=Nymphaea colorata TaxID=210225 RepID=A0A5K0XLF1_9MAGN
MGFLPAIIFFSGTFTDFSIRSAVGTMGKVGANPATKVRICGIGHLGLTLSEILHMGATKTAPFHDWGSLKWIKRQIAPPMDSP